ncbi:tetratricopeptide repeat protein [Microbispora bryophytorum]|uniref:Co-chaperone YbbN n=1 Tax=Microbispora bryophytorum TaxID=1460882 RepID=A0A8H9H1J3_9ACTN|nr:tetratricopeptide repeat protein [Microbispora bryophytorum]MBD3137507.1 tetratricopeptide repeat protein [Microbispora bryophytorum]TQS05817.1 tetratricopeptide repeat protein [Microbispora bryophytorum]GGO19438.1 co-chaperone YbbN [Microbispora bryophytorum]
MAADFSRPGSLYGAVDLGARKQTLEAQARREAAGPSGAASADVIEVTSATFNAEVVERSLSVPVIVEATVSRAEQVRQFSGVMEKLAAEAAGAWVLARVDVEADPQLAQALRMRAVPTVYLAFQGQLMPLFEGPLPEAQLRQALSQVFEQLGMEPAAPAEDEPAEPPVDPELLAAEEAVEKGDLDAAAVAYERLLARSPSDEGAKIGLAGVGLLQRTQDLDPADVQRRVAGNADDVDAQTQAADLEMVNGQVDEAFDRLVAVVRRTRGADRDKARVHLLGLFDALPADDPSVSRARRALANALF